MKRRAIAALCMAAALTGCASGQTWQVVEVYTDPSVPGALPDRANFRVHGSTFEGTTPCARVEGSFTLEDATLTLTTAHQTPLANNGDNGDTCFGAGRYTHNQLMSVATEGAVFEVRGTSSSERLLVLTGHDELNPPSIRVLRERP